ncbi:MAG: hypothetical protein QXK78_03100 [Candidatus Bathyarchaeia archaeon]
MHLENKKYLYRVAALWALALMLITFYLSVSGSVIGINYYPAVPREGDPIQVTVRLHNPNPEPKTYAVKVYVDGVKAAEWLATLEGGAIKEYRLLEPKSLKIGESLRVYAEAADITTAETHQASAMIPPYPPEAFTSFISFASFSSTLMGYMTTMSYYTTTITPTEGINTGLTLSIVLIGLLIFIELTDPAYGKIGDRIKHLRRNLTKEATILLIIFLAMAATKIAFIIYGA